MVQSVFAVLIDGPVLHLCLRTEYVPSGPGGLTPIRVLRVHGEVDAVTAPRLAEALARAQASGPLPGSAPQRVVVDVSAMTFCSVRGLAVLHSAAERATAEQGTVSIAGLSARLVGLLATLWPSPYPEFHLAPPAARGLDDPRRVGSSGTRATGDCLPRPGGAPRCVPPSGTACGPAG